MKPRSVRVVITGLGAVTSVGLSAEQTWQALLAGQSGIRKSTQVDPTNYPVKISGEVKGFSPTDYITVKDVRRMARFSQLAVAASREALLDAGLLELQEMSSIRHVSPIRIGVILGTCLGGFTEIRNSTETLLARGSSCISPRFVMMMLHNAAAANVSCQFGLMGYNSTTTNSCAAATQAIGEATAVIRRGEADIMVAGGAEHPLSDLGLSGFMAMRAITTAHNDCPQRASRPFDLNRSGLVGAEGAASLVLERLEYAQARDAHIYAEVVGFGCSSNAGHLASPDSDGAARAMSNALVDADVAPADVDYINAHATSTPLGDAAETSAIKRVFGGAAYDIPISATKSMTGHTIGASGAISAIVSVLTIRDGIIHPTINYETPDPECDLDYVPNQARKTSVKLALSNSFGMGGQNTALLLSKIN